MLNLPLARGGQCFAALLVYLPEERDFNQSKIDVAYSFAQQLGLLIRLRELAEDSKAECDCARERGGKRTARSGVVKATAVLSSTLNRIAEELDLSTSQRTILPETINQTGAQDGIIMLYKLGTNELHIAETVLPESSLDEESKAFSLPLHSELHPDRQVTPATSHSHIIDFEKDTEMLRPELGFGTEREATNFWFGCR